MATRKLDLATVLACKFPGKYEDGGYEVRLDESHGGEQYIYKWNEAIMGAPEPSEGDLDEWELPCAQALKKRELNRKANAEYLQQYVVEGEFLEFTRDQQLVREIRERARPEDAPPVLTDTDHKRIAKREQIAAKLGDKRQLVNNATDVGEIQQIDWEVESG